MAQDLQMFVDGKWVDAVDGGRFDVFNPATGEVIATVPDAQPADVERAVGAARRIFDGGSWWPAVTERERGRILLNAADIVRRELERLAELETLDSGKPLGEAMEDIAEVAFMFEYYGGWATKIDGYIPPVGPDAMSLVVKEPMGVAAGITPWNYPMMMAVQKVAPAIAAGCTFILKPAEQTPLTALEIPKILEEAGLPPGVVQVITGFGETAGAPLVEIPGVDKIGFTGSRDVGKMIMRSGADTLKRVTLELGGKSPEHRVRGRRVRGRHRGVGQRDLLEPGRDLLRRIPRLHRAIDLRRRAEPAHQPREGRRGRRRDAIRTRRWGRWCRRSSRTACSTTSTSDRRRRPSRRRAMPPRAGDLAGGYFVPPTIFADASNDMTIAREEIFGPVMTVIPFDGVEEVIELSNDNPYGLAAAVWSRDIKKAINTAKALRAGIVWINDTQPAPTEAPWGGYKQSGIGRELGKEGVADYLEEKHIYINLAE